MRLIKQVLMKSGLFRKFSTRYSAVNDLLPSVFTHTPSDRLRQFLFLPPAEGTTQLNQDIFALVVNRFSAGYFVEIGANDGFTLSNTAYLEEHFGWNGLLIEANPAYSPGLSKRKSAHALMAVTTEEGEVPFRDAGLYGGIVDTLDPLHDRYTQDAKTIKVRGAPLEKIFSLHDVPLKIDFISIDVEGAEVAIVEQMCVMKGYRFKCGCIEHNGRTEDYEKIKRFLESADYQVVWENQTAHDLFFIDGGEL